MITNEDKDKVLEFPDDVWSPAYYRDEFFIHLCRIKDKDKDDNHHRPLFLTDYKYYAQAKKIMYWIPIADCRQNTTFHNSHRRSKI